MMIQREEDQITRRLAFYLSHALWILTVITFGIAIFAIPIAGPYCPDGCIEYPYLDIVSRFPRDYWWMFPAMVLTGVYLALLICIKEVAPRDRRVFGAIAVAFGIIATGLLITDYFIQVSMIQVSLLEGETEGIALFTQYNGHGLFIVLEDLGYLLISFSLFAMAPLFSGGKRERFLRWLFVGGFALNVLALAYFIFEYGHYREYRFEVFAISVDWLIFIAAGLLLASLFASPRRR